MNEVVKCRRCGQEKPADGKDKHLCVDCALAERNRYSHLRKNQGNWMEIAEEAGIAPWLQQPGETQHEYTIWVAYRDSYPGKKPSYREVAEQCNTTYDFVRAVAQRWSFQARMQAWMTECDRITMQQRRNEILDMNKEHIDMAQRLRNKMSAAIDCIDPSMIKPSELGSLMRVAAELESKARVDTIAQEEMLRELTVDKDESSDLKKSPTKQSDLGEVVNILLNAGALGSVTQIGVRETTTREVVAKDASGNEVSLVQDE